MSVFPISRKRPPGEHEAKGGIDKLTGEGVEDDIDAAVLCGAAEVGFEVEVSGGSDVVGAKPKARRVCHLVGLAVAKTSAPR